MDATTEESRGEVAVVGAGPAGIAAAFRIQQAGYRVRIYESDDRVGGRTKTTRLHGFAFDSGAMNVVSSYSYLLSILDEAGLSDQVAECGSMIAAPRNGATPYIEADQRLRDIPALLRTQLVSTRSKFKLARLAFDVIRARPQLTYDNLWRATGLDTESAGAYARRVLNDEILDNVVDAVVRGSICLPADELSKADFFFSLAHWMGVKLLTLRDGMSSYAEMMASRFDVELGTAVLEVEESKGEVLLTSLGPDGTQKTARHTACVVAVPAAASAELVPQLDSWRKTYLATLPYIRSVVVHLAQRRPVNQPAALFLPAKSCGTDISVINVVDKMTPWRIPAGKGMISTIVGANLGAQLIDQDDDQILAAVLPVIEGVQKGLTGDVEWTHIDRWNPLLPLHRPGFTGPLATFHHLAQANDGLIQLAGDYWALGCVETSTASGTRAARAIVDELNRTSRSSRAAKAPSGKQITHV